MGSLDSIIKLSSSDLAKNGLFVTRGELGRTSTFVVSLSLSTSLILPTVDFPRPVLDCI